MGVEDKNWLLDRLSPLVVSISGIKLDLSFGIEVWVESCRVPEVVRKSTSFVAGDVRKYRESVDFWSPVVIFEVVARLESFALSISDEGVRAELKLASSLFSGGATE